MVKFFDNVLLLLFKLNNRVLMFYSEFTCGGCGNFEFPLGKCTAMYYTCTGDEQAVLNTCPMETFFDKTTNACLYRQSVGFVVFLLAFNLL